MDDDTSAAMDKVKQYVYPRRLRIKEHFRHYDRLRSGTVTESRFLRGVFSIGGNDIVSSKEVGSIANQYRRSDDLIDYVSFCEEIETVYGPTQLNLHPFFDSVATTGPPVCQLGKVEAGKEERLQEILLQLSLLARTRGVVIKYCFQDFDRSEAASLTVPRHSGKVPRDVFRRQFPFRSHFSEDDVKIVIKRYSDQHGMVHYRALHDDLSGSAAMEESLPLRSIEHDTLRWSNDDVSPVERIQARIIEKRLVLRDYFQDFDSLRKGYCAPCKARTVFAILDLKVSDADFATLCDEFCRDGMFHYEAFQDRVDSFSTKGLEMRPLERLVPPCDSPVRKNCARLTPEQYDRLEMLEDKVRVRIRATRLPIRDIFSDFDATHQWHVTESQFVRVLSMLMPIASDDAALLATRYADRGNMLDINYMEFCVVVDPPSEDTVLAQKHCNAPFQAVTASKYFDAEGEIIPVV